jgi:hypothetical protein
MTGGKPFDSDSRLQAIHSQTLTLRPTLRFWPIFRLLARDEKPTLALRGGQALSVNIPPTACGSNKSAKSVRHSLKQEFAMHTIRKVQAQSSELAKAQFVNLVLFQELKRINIRVL